MGGYLAIISKANLLLLAISYGGRLGSPCAIHPPTHPPPNQRLNIQLSHCYLSLPFARDERFSQQHQCQLRILADQIISSMQRLLGALALFLLPLLSSDTQVTQQDSSYECLLAANIYLLNLHQVLPTILPSHDNLLIVQYADCVHEIESTLSIIL